MKGIIFRLSVALLILLPSSLWAASFSVMTYNVENLFDTLNDEGKNDYTYLPIEVKRSTPEVYAFCRTIQVPPWRNECYSLDWNEEVVATKIKNLARVIHDFNGGNKPDILVLQEVENINVLNQLNQQGRLNYKNVILIEGDDSRGIDVAILSNFPLIGEPKLHYIDSRRRVKTRGILEAKFDVMGKSVVVFANHWPSQFNPDELRVLAAKKLMQASSRARADIRIAAGDYNSKPHDPTNGLNDLVLKPKRSIYFTPTNPNIGSKEIGSHWYQGKWEYIDRILIDSKSRENGVTTSHILHVEDYMLTEREYRRNGKTLKAIVPFRYDPVSMTGYADHLPVGAIIHLP